jgi:hypothetical protein
MASNFKTTINGTNVSLSDIFDQTKTTSSIDSAFKDSDGTSLKFGSFSGSTTSIVYNNKYIDEQRNSSSKFIRSNGGDVSDYYSATYTDYGTSIHSTSATASESSLSSGNITIPAWCDYLICIIVGGGGWINYGRDTNDQHWTSGSGGEGGLVAWKSPTSLGGNNFSYKVTINYGTRSNTDGHDGDGGQSKVEIINSSNTTTAYAIANGGDQANWVDGNDDDDTHVASRVGGSGGNHTISGGTELYSTTGNKGMDSVNSRNDGVTNSKISQASKVHGWNNQGQGAYWDNGDGDNINSTRIDGGINGAVRVYFIAYNS